jgi:hypothetical protein
MPMVQSREASAAAILDILRGTNTPHRASAPFYRTLQGIVTAYGLAPVSDVEELLAQQILQYLGGGTLVAKPQSLTRTFDDIAIAVGVGARGSVDADLAAWLAVVQPIPTYSEWAALAITLGASHLWRLDDPEGSETVNDLIGGAPGTVGGLVTLGAAPLLNTGETSGSFPGDVGNRIQVPAGNMPIGNAARTVVIWLATDQVAPADYNIWGYGAAAGGQAYGIQRSGALNNAQLFFYVFGNDQTVELPDGADIADGNPHQLGVSFDPATEQVIFNWDGVASDTVKDFGGAIATADTPFDIGGSNNIIGVRWLGREAYCATFPLALTHEQMASCTNWEHDDEPDSGCRDLHL